MHQYIASMNSSPLHSILFFLPDNISDTVFYNIIICILCILVIFSLAIIYRRFNNWSSVSLLEGMTSTTSNSVSPSPSLDPDVANVRSQTDALQTVYDKLKDGINNQKNRIDGNSQMLLKIMSDVPNQTNNLTHANINADDPSKTKIPSIDMS